MQLSPVPLRAAVAFAVLALAGSTAIARTPAPDQLLAAIKYHQQGRWSAAYGKFAELADRGHPEAARIALFMVRYGPRLYGTPWSASTMQIEDWTWSAGKQQPPLEADGGD